MRESLINYINALRAQQSPSNDTILIEDVIRDLQIIVSKSEYRTKSLLGTTKEKINKQADRYDKLD